MEIPYAELARKAKNQVEDLEEPYKTAAYQTILNDLIQEAKRAKEAKPAGQKPVTRPETADDPVEFIMTNRVDGTKFARLFASRGRFTEKSLAVLKIAKDQFGIDGLTAPQITQILVRKFRVPRVYRQNVGFGLSRATEFVTRITANGDYKYLLMATGEQHLEEVLGQL